MIAAASPVQRPPDARLLMIDAALTHYLRSAFVDLLEAGDLIVANDAATIPASLSGIHARTGRPIEVRLAGRPSLACDRVCEFTAIVFGAGDFRMRTEDRPAPPLLRPSDRLTLGPLSASIRHVLDHPRLIELRFDGDPSSIWAGLARHGRPIQYSHLPQPVALWDTWTSHAAMPVALEPPSAGFIVDWALVDRLRARGVGFATLTHAAGISSTGDHDLDAHLPFDEPYDIPLQTCALINTTRRRGGRVIALGTTVVRALEHAAAFNGSVRPGPGLATQKIGAGTTLQVVDAILSGTHEHGTSHYELLRAFVDDRTLRLADRELNARAYRTHEFGDSVFVVRQRLESRATTGQREP